MQVPRIDNMFNFTFEKPAEEIVAAAAKKAAELRTKIEERIIRIKKLRADHQITDAVLIDIQNQMREQQKRGIEAMSYTSNARSSGTSGVEEVTVGAGTINNLLTEQDYISGERTQVERLDTIARNLKPVTAYLANGQTYTVLPKLGYDELKYLGF